MRGFFDYYKNYSLNEKILACALYKEAVIIFRDDPVWRVGGNLRISGLVEELNLSEDVMRNAQLSKGVWESMSEDNKKQFIYSFVDMMDIVTFQLEDAALAQALANKGVSKESFYNMMAENLGYLIDDVMGKIGVNVLVNIKERRVILL